jgi:hypothetical protein
VVGPYLPRRVVVLLQAQLVFKPVAQAVVDHRQRRRVRCSSRRKLMIR